MVMRRTEPLTEAECALLADGKMTKAQLARRFRCSDTTIQRAIDSVLAGVTTVYLFKKPQQPSGVKRVRIKDPDAVSPENPLGLDPVGACNAHLEDLRRVYGSSS